LEGTSGRAAGRHRRIVASVVIVLVAAVATLVYFVWLRPTEPTVQVTTVHTQNLKNTIFSSGLVKPVQRQVINPTDLPAPVKKLEVKVGEQVKPGQILLQCNDPAALSALKSAQQQEADAEKNYNRVLASIKSLQSSLASVSGGAPGNSVQGEVATILNSQLQATLASQLQAAQTALDEAKSAVAQAQQSQGATTIKATLAGTVIIASPQGIQPDGSTGPVIEIVQGRTIVADLSQSDAVNVKSGMPATVTSQAFPNKSWKAVVTQVSPYSSSDTSGNGQVEVTIGQLPTGFSVPWGYQVDVNIISQVHRHALVVPYSALVQSGTNYSVFVVKSGRVTETPVTLGITSNSVVEVVKGVQAKETVVVNPPANLQNGRMVRVR